MEKSDLLFVTKVCIFWIFSIFLILLFSVRFVPLQQNFLGGGLSNYIANPFLWTFANFDGEHYLSIVENGYQPLTYFYFPLYPLVIRLVSSILGKSIFEFLISGIFVSYICFFASVIGFVKLLKIDFEENIMKIAVVVLVLFPTSFYFGSVYTESLFLALSVWSLYFARKGDFILAGIIAGFASGTRVVGIILFPTLLCELYIQKKMKINFGDFVGVSISLFGMALYLIYLKIVTGSYLEFFNNVGIFGQHRQSTLISLPQVFYRYFFKIVPSLSFQYFPGTYTTLLELVISLLFLIAIILSFNKMRLSYWIFLVLGYIIPTLSGSFSSLPRYVLVLFPFYIFLAEKMVNNKTVFFAFLSISFILLIISFSLFSRGYWVS